MKLKDVYTGVIYGNEELIESAPLAEGRISIFKPVKQHVSCEEVRQEYEKARLVPVHPLDLAKMVENLHNEPVATQWKDKDDNWCCAAFGRWDGGRLVYVERRDLGWFDGWSFAGVPQVAEEIMKAIKEVSPNPSPRVKNEI